MPSESDKTIPRRFISTASTGNPDLNAGQVSDRKAAIEYRYRLIPPQGIEYISPNVEMLTGYPPHIWTADAQWLFQIVHPDDREDFRKDWMDRVDGRQPLRLRWRRRDGSLLWVEHTRKIIHDSNGEPLAYECSVLPILPAEQAANPILEFVRLLSSIPIAAALLSPADVRLVAVNDDFIALTGFSRNESAGRTLTELGWTELDSLLHDIGNHTPVHDALTTIPQREGPSIDVLISLSGLSLEGQDFWLLLMRWANGHQRAAEALRQSEERYRAFLQRSSDGIWRFELRQPVPIHLPEEEQLALIYEHAYLTECNDQMARMYDFNDASEIGGLNLSDLFPKSVPRYVDFVREFIRNGYSLINAETTREKDGRKSYYLNNLYGIVENGQLLRAWGTRQDITARRKAEQVQTAVYHIAQAAVSSENLEELFRSIHEILGHLMPAENFFIALYDDANDTLSFPYFVDAYDQAPTTKKPGRGITEYVLRIGRPLFASPEVFAELVRQGEVVEMGAPSIDWMGVPLVARGRTIGVLAVQSYAEGVRYGEEELRILEFVSSQVAMVIERKQAEDVRRISEERYRGILEDQTELICRWQPDGTFTYVNEAYCRHVGKTREELIGSKFAVQTQNGDRQAHALALVASGGQSVPYEVSVQYPDGELRWEQWIDRPIYGPDGQLIEFQSVGQDITERKQREYELQAIASVSSALRKASNRVEMLPVILDQLMDLLHADGAALAMVDALHNELAFELGRGEWDYLTGMRLPLGVDLPGYVFSTGQPYVSNDVFHDPHLTRTELVDGLPASALAPLIAQGQTIGLVWIGKRGSFSHHNQNLLTAIADIAANAIQRSALFEQTQLRLQRLTVLRAIDMAVSASLDVHVTLNILLDQVNAQLGVDAADVLLFNPHNQMLEYAAGRGFFVSGFLHAFQRLGEGQAGRAAMERQIIHLPDLHALQDGSQEVRFHPSEKFVSYSAVPLIAKGLVKGVLELFYRRPTSADSEWLEFLQSLGASAAVAIDNAELLDKLQRSNVELSLAYEATIEGWSHALELRDRETEGHTQRVTELTLRLARRMGVPENELVHIRRGALLHDIGKLAIPDSILFKEGDLTDAEWEVMRKHPVYAYQLLSPIPYLRPALDIPYYHHERWNGSGYPFGLRGEQIPLAARIFAVVDVWDALRSDRPYRKAWPDAKTIEYIRSQAGIGFDPQVVAAFLELESREGLREI